MIKTPDTLYKDIIFESAEFTWETNAKAEYTYLSNEVEKILGFKPKEMLGKTPFSLMPHYHASKHQKVFQQFQKKPKPFVQYNTKRVHKSGRIIHIETNGFPIYKKGDLVGYKGVSKDITKRIQYQKNIDDTYYHLKKINKHLRGKIELEVQKNKEKDAQLFAQSKQAAMGDMIGNIAHQWRQPLSIISATASAIKINHEIQMLNTEDIPKQMNTILEQTQYLSKTIETFMNYIKEKKEYKRVHLQKTLLSSLQIVQTSLEHNNIKIIHNLKKSSPIKLNTISSELQEVMINLINNAKDAIKINQQKDGLILINVKEENDYALITIQDNGGGIKEDILSRIFDPYFTTKHQYQGTGLGLNMSYKIITQHLQGEILATNTPIGALFSIKLPYKIHNNLL